MGRVRKKECAVYLSCLGMSGEADWGIGQTAEKEKGSMRMERDKKRDSEEDGAVGGGKITEQQWATCVCSLSIGK